MALIRHDSAIPRWRMPALRRMPGVLISVPQPGYPAHPASAESFVPFDGPPGTTTGPAETFNVWARWRAFYVKDPPPVQPSVAGLWPTLYGRRGSPGKKG